MFSLPLSFSEEIPTPENKTMGCGFIPPNILVELLGYGSLDYGKNAFDCMAVQIRIVSPFLGIFKGIIIKKEGISKIQLPSSMKKVGLSEKQQKNKDSHKKN